MNKVVLCGFPRIVYFCKKIEPHISRFLFLSRIIIPHTPLPHYNFENHESSCGCNFCTTLFRVYLKVEGATLRYTSEIPTWTNMPYVPPFFKGISNLLTQENTILHEICSFNLLQLASSIHHCALNFDNLVMHEREIDLTCYIPTRFE